MKKILTLILGLIISTQFLAQKVVVSGKNLSKESFAITIIADKDTISYDEGFKKYYFVEVFEIYPKITVLFSTKDYTKTLVIYPSSKQLWVKLDVDLNNSNDASLVYDPEYRKYRIITKAGSSELLD